MEAVAAAAIADVVAVDGASAGLFAHKYHTKEYYDLPKMIYLLDWPYGLHEQLVNNWLNHLISLQLWTLTK